jgi:hypothetical protein
MLYWAVDPAGGDWQDSSDPYKFAMNWFAECCAADGSGNSSLDLCVDMGCSQVNENGLEAEAISSVLGNNPLSVFTNYTGGPSKTTYPNVPNNFAAASVKTGIRFPPMSSLKSPRRPPAGNV